MTPPSQVQFVEQRDEHLSLDAIKSRLAHMSAEEIEAYATAKLTTGPAATALGVERPPMAVATARSANLPSLRSRNPVPRERPLSDATS